MNYISICNWEKHQHYKDRIRIHWIKLKIDIIEEFDENDEPKSFYKLPDQAKLTYVCLLCLRAKHNKRIPYKSDEWLAEQLGIASVDLGPLVAAGYINIDTDGVPEPYQNRTTLVAVDKEKERKEYKEREEELIKRVGAEAPPEDLTKEDLEESSLIKIKGELAKLTETLYQEKIFREAPKFKNQMLKQGKNPRAILHTLIRCQIKKPDDPWGYCTKIIQVVDGNYNERDQTKTA